MMEPTAKAYPGEAPEGEPSDVDGSAWDRLPPAVRSAASAAKERELADLIARYYRREIGRLMQQAEHWARENYPLAVHHRVLTADAYFQFVALCERFQKWGKNPFQEMREELSREPIKPPGRYPPTAEIHAYREPAFVIEKLKTAPRAAGGTAVAKPDSHINKCPNCHRMFKDGETCGMGGCPMGGDF